jgi:hypothetical protein
MASVSRPFGLRPAYSPSGALRPAAYSIAAAYATNILNDQPVKIGANGTIEAAAVGDRFIGTFSGVEWTTPDGQLRVSNRWAASTPTLAGTPIIAYVTLDSSIVYEMQANGPVAVTDIGSQADFTTAGTGSAVTGLSTMMLDVTGSLTNSGSAGLRIIGISPGPDNAPGDAFTVVQVQISEHQNVADRVAY